MGLRVEFTIQGRPVPWARAGAHPGTDGRTKQMRHFTPHKQRSAMSTVRKEYQAQCTRERRNGLLLFGALKLEVLCVYEIPKSWPARKRAAAVAGHVWKTSVPDIDNLAKLISDALNGIAYGDDACIAVSSVAKRYGAPERTVVRLSQLPDWVDALPSIGLPGRQETLSL